MKPVAIAFAALLLASCESAPVANSPPDEQQRREFVLNVSRAGPGDWLVLCDTDQLRVAIRNDAVKLFVEAIVWNDGDGKLGVYRVSNRPVGDYAELMVHFGDERERLAMRDVDISLNPWPERQGVYITKYETTTATSPLQKSKGGAGSIEYLRASGGTLIRVDRFEIPLAEIRLSPGDTIKVAYYVSSPAPNIVLNSAVTMNLKEYYSHQIPIARFREFKLQN